MRAVRGYGKRAAVAAGKGACDMPIFTIDRATTRVSCESRDGIVRETRTLVVEGPAGDGCCNEARLVFGPDPAGPAVGYVTRSGVSGVSLVGWLPAAAFGAFRDAIAGGGPVHVHYETREGQAGYLRRIGLGRAGRALSAVVGRRPGTSAGVVFAMPH
jgi:hypothetical protein